MERRANQSQTHIRSITTTVLLAKKLLSHFKYFISLKKDNIENKENKKETKERNLKSSGNWEDGSGGKKQMKPKALIVATVSGFLPQFEMGNVRILQKFGYEVHYASNFKTPAYGQDNNRLYGTGIICHQIDFERSPFSLPAAVRAYRQMKKLLQKSDFSLIHCHTPMGGAIARIAAVQVEKKRNKTHCKVIYTAHGFHFYKGAPLFNWLLYYPAECLLARCTDMLITINLEDYRRAQHFCRDGRCLVEHVPGTGIDLEAYCLDKEARMRIRRKLGMCENQVLLLSVGELNRNKNHQIILRALSARGRKEVLEDKDKSEDIYYIICGKGRGYFRLRRMILRYGLKDHVFLMGYQSNIGDFLSACDIFVLPSRREGLSRSLQEAMAASKPVIASDIRGNRELLGESPFRKLILPDDVAGFRKSIQYIGKKDLAREGKYNREKIKAYSKERVEAKMERIYRQVILQKGRSEK